MRVDLLTGFSSSRWSRLWPRLIVHHGWLTPALRVIKIERAEGDFARAYDSVVHGESAYFVWLNRGKESLVANIKDEKDKKLLLRIIDQADVFIQNLALRGAAARAGFGSKELQTKFEPYNGRYFWIWRRGIVRRYEGVRFAGSGGVWTMFNHRSS